MAILNTIVSQHNLFSSNKRCFGVHIFSSSTGVAFIPISRRSFYDVDQIEADSILNRVVLSIGSPRSWRTRLKRARLYQLWNEAKRPSIPIFCARLASPCRSSLQFSMIFIKHQQFFSSCSHPAFFSVSISLYFRVCVCVINWLGRQTG